MNPLNKFNNQIPQQGGNMNPMQMLSEFKKFASEFKGNPEQEVMNMLTNGKMSKEQFEQITQQAKQIQNLFNQLGIK